MSCRQYTCPNCWNEAEARCLSCAPHLGHEIMPAPFPDMPATPVAPAASVTPAFLRAATDVERVERVGPSDRADRRQRADRRGRDRRRHARTASSTPRPDWRPSTGPVEEPPVVDSDIPYLTAASWCRPAAPEAIAAPELIGQAEAVAADRGRGRADAVAGRGGRSAELIGEAEAEAVARRAGRGRTRGGRRRTEWSLPSRSPWPHRSAVAAEAVAEPDVTSAPEADLAAAAIVQEAAEPDRVVADEPATTEAYGRHPARTAGRGRGRRVDRRRRARTGGQPEDEGGRPDQRTPPPLPTRPESRRGARCLRARPRDGADAATGPASAETPARQARPDRAGGGRRGRPAAAPAPEPEVAGAGTRRGMTWSSQPVVADGRPRSVRRRAGDRRRRIAPSVPRRGEHRPAPSGRPPAMADDRRVGQRTAVPRPPAAPQGGLEALWAAVEPRGRCHAGRRRARERRRPAVRQLRAVTVRQRPVLPALRDPPGRLTRRARRSSSRTRTQAAP